MVEEDLKEYIIRNFQSISNFANLINMPESTIRSMLKRGLKTANLDNIFKITEYLDLDVNRLGQGELVKNVKKEIRSLNPEEIRLINTFYALNDFNKKTIIDLAERLRDGQDNEIVTLIPIIERTIPQVTQLDYYPQAARMGTGQVVEDAIPEKVNVLSSQVPPNADFIIRVVGDSMEPNFRSGDLLYIQKTNVLELGDVGLFNINGEQMVKEYGAGELISYNKMYPPIDYKNCDLYIQGKVLGRV